jgi:VWFA-related protein
MIRMKMSIRVAACAPLICISVLAQVGDGPSLVLPTFRAEVRLVEVYASIFDNRGNPLPNLTRERFQVFDAGQPQALAAFEGADDALSCALLLDTTGSMTDFLPALKSAALRFVDELTKEQSVAVYTFTRTLQAAQPFTTDKMLLKRAVMRTSAGGGTRLFDSVAQVARDLEARRGKKALVLFTDGDDNASTLKAEGAARQASQSGVPVYVIAQGNGLKDVRLMKILEGLANGSGGLSFRLTRPDKIGNVFSEISRDLRHTYLLGWKRPEAAGTAWRPVKIVVTNVGDAHIRARQGYWPE